MDALEAIPAMSRLAELAPVLLMGVLALLLVSCSGAYAPLRPVPDPEPPVIADLAPVALPADQFPHRNLSEWWYFTGHLEDVNGHQYGFEFVIFAGQRANLPRSHAAHFALSDLTSKTFLYAQRTSAADGSDPNLGAALCVGGWRLNLADDGFTILARDGEIGLELELDISAPAVLHNRSGIIDFSPYGWSYYYSHPRLSASGVVTIAGQSRAVAGEAWFDHQWGDFIVTGDGGWDWFSLQLADRRELMVTVVRGEDDQVAAIYGTISGSSGGQTHLVESDILIAPLGQWKSPSSNASYPAGWHLQVPSQEIDLVIEPHIADSELDATASTGSFYWEGSVVARQGADPVGRGFVELTGYAEVTRAPPTTTVILENQCGR